MSCASLHVLQPPLLGQEPLGQLVSIIRVLSMPEAKSSQKTKPSPPLRDIPLCHLPC